MHARRVLRTALVTVAVALAFAGCNSGEREPEAETTGDEPIELPEISVTIPPERLTPFCQAMIDLSAELIEDPPEDPRARIIEVYESLAGEVPADIAIEFNTVLDRLKSGAPSITTPTAPPPVTSVAPNSIDVPNTTSPFADEGYDPDADPTTRLAEYVRFACTDAANNPGPGPTEPGAADQSSPSD